MRNITSYRKNGRPVVKKLMLPLTFLLSLLVVAAGAILWVQYRTFSAGMIHEYNNAVAQEFAYDLDVAADNLLSIVSVLSTDRHLVQSVKDGQWQGLINDMQAGISQLRRTGVSRMELLDADRRRQIILSRAGLLQTAGNNSFLPSAKEKRLEVNESGQLVLLVEKPVFAGEQLVGFFVLGREIEKSVFDLHADDDRHLVLSVLGELMPPAVCADSDNLRAEDSGCLSGCGLYFAFATDDALVDIIRQNVERNPDTGYSSFDPSLNIKYSGRRWRMAVTPFFDFDGQHIGCLFVMLDISEIRLSVIRYLLWLGGLSSVLAAFLLAVYFLLARTDRYISEQQTALSQTRSDFALYIESAPQGIFITDKEGQYIEVNQAACDMTGFSRKELLGMSVADLASPLIQQENMQSFAKLRESGRVRQEILLRCGDGSDLPVLLDAVALSNGRMLGFCADISGQKKAARELAKAMAQAEAGNRAKTEFLSVMSHEIRTPLNAILGFTELLEATPLTSEQNSFLQDTIVAARALMGLVDDILHFSRIETRDVAVYTEAVNIKQLFEQTAAAMTERAQAKNLKFSWQIDESVPEYIVCDSLSVRHIIVNLLGNAVKFTEAGMVDVRVSGDKKQKLLRFVVRDTGPGLSREYQQRVFDAFWQADTTLSRRYGGTGLGLAISQRLAQAMGGNIAVDSRPGSGSTFTFVMPYADCDDDQLSNNFQTFVADKDNKPLARIDGREQPGTALIVEDDLVNMRLVQRLISKSMPALRILQAENGQECLNIVQQSISAGETIDCILMDVQMPIMDGLAATRSIRKMEQQSGQHIAIVALTAGTTDEQRRHCFEAGMDDFLSKPIHTDVLVKVLKRHIFGDN